VTRVAGAVLFLVVALSIALDSSASDAIASGRCTSETILRGDVDGDRARDRVSLSGRWDEGHGCRFVLAVGSAIGKYRLRLREGLLEAPNVNVRIASLLGLARIDSRPGSEILVMLNNSASGLAVGVYTFRDGHLRYVPIEGRNRIEGIFWHNQAGLGGSRADCWKRAASGYVVTMEYQVDSSGEGADIDIDRQLWRTNGSMFRLLWSRHYRKTHRSFPEQRTSSPFGHCLTRG
jgi:hypothetical protein